MAYQPRPSFSSRRCAPRGNPTHNALLLVAFGAFVLGGTVWPTRGMMWCWLPGGSLFGADLLLRLTPVGQRVHLAITRFADCKSGVSDLEEALGCGLGPGQRVLRPLYGGYMLYVPTWVWALLPVAAGFWLRDAMQWLPR